ncbi:MAG TPA: hypothetical protein VI231_02870 [Candidatus Binatia bacterium]
MLLLKINQSLRKLPRSGTFAVLRASGHGTENQTAGDESKEVQFQRCEAVKKCHLRSW